MARAASEKKDDLVKTYFYIPEALWKRVEVFNEKAFLSSDAAAARFLMSVALKNEKGFEFVELPQKMTTKGIAFHAQLREQIFKFQHRHYIDDKQTAYCQLINYGLAIMKPLVGNK